MQQVLVLNASYEPLNVCSLRRAHVLVYKGKAEVVEELSRPLRSASNTYRWPHVIRLITYVRVPRMVQRKISRRATFSRDGWRCVYSSTAGSRTGDRLPHGVHMVLSASPRPPAPVLFIRLATPKIPARWERYLAPYATSTSHHAVAAA